VRALIMADMEGVAGICRWEQVMPGDSAYDECRILYTEEINAAVRGAFASGAEQVGVMDCHGAGGGVHMFNSLVPDVLDIRCEWIVQESWPQYTDVFAGCDAVLLIGMHAMAGTNNGVLNHTMYSEGWRNVWFNNVLVGEVGFNSALAGNWNAPVVLVTGDEATCAEATGLLGKNLVTTAVKKGLGRLSAVHLSPAKAREAIEIAAREAMNRRAACPHYDPGSPCEIVVEFATSDHLDKFRHKRAVEWVDNLKLASRADNWLSAWQQFYL
jgi:D-amino peptidase